MKQDATVSDPREALTGPQRAALERLLLGGSVTEAASAASVNRSTLYRWLRADHTFQAALNAGKRELVEEMGLRMLRLAKKAAEAVESALVGGDGRLGLEVLRGQGLLSGKGPSVGDESPERLRKREAESARLDELLGLI